METSHGACTGPTSGTLRTILAQCALKTCIGLRVVAEVVEKRRHIVNGVDDNVSQTAAGIDGIMADAHAEAAIYLSKPGRAPARKAGSIRFIFGKKLLLLFNSCKECRYDIL